MSTENLSFSIAQYADCVEELVAFRNKNRAIQRNQSYFDWRYQQRPCDLRPVILWAKRAGQAVGALSVFPHDYFIRDKEYPVGMLGDISVNPEFRGQGIGGLMFRYLKGIDLQQQLSGGIVIPNDDAARPLEKAGWDEAGIIERYVKILDVSDRLSNVNKGARWTAILAGIINQVMRWTSYEQLSQIITSSDLEGAVVGEVDSRFDDLWHRSDKRGRILGVRNAAYLRWRYQNHPTNRYLIFTLSQSTSLMGYVIYQMRDEKCIVEDLYAESGGRLTFQLLGQFLSHARGLGAHSITVNVNRSYFRFPWRGFGFVKRLDSQRFMITATSSGIGIPHGSESYGWHVTTGDKDV